jgi:glucose/arabinose dehydrogenase
MKLAAAGLATLISTSALAQSQVFRSPSGDLRVETVATGLVHPWALAFLPDGRMLVTERPGRLRIVTRDGKLSPPVEGLPPIFVRGQGGLLDVILDRNYAQNKTVYFCFADPFDGGGRTVLARARLDDGAKPRLDDLKIIFRQEGPPSTGNHYGCRIVHMPDNNLFLTMGDHYGPRDEAQNLRNHLGKIVRLRPDGRCRRQSLRQPAGCEAGNLVLRPPQRARRRDQSRERKILDA